MQNLLNEPQHTLRFWGCGKVSSKQRTFRLSQKSTNNLETYTKTVTHTNDSNSLNVILEKLFEPQRSEQPKKETGDFFSLPPFLRCQDTETETWLPTKQCTGDFFSLPPFLRCQDTETETWLPTKQCLERCQTCNVKKFCEAWKHKQLF